MIWLLLGYLHSYCLEVLSQTASLLIVDIVWSITPFDKLTLHLVLSLFECVFCFRYKNPLAFQFVFENFVINVNEQSKSIGKTWTKRRTLEIWKINSRQDLVLNFIFIRIIENFQLVVGLEKKFGKLYRAWAGPQLMIITSDPKYTEVTLVDCSKEIKKPNRRFKFYEFFSFLISKK